VVMLDMQNMSRPAPGAGKGLPVRKADFTCILAAAGNFYTEQSSIREVIDPVVYRGFLVHRESLLKGIFSIIAKNL